MGSSNETSAFGPVKKSVGHRPRARAAVRADRRWRSLQALFARRFGSETGGSVRQPLALRRRRVQADLRPHLALRPRAPSHRRSTTSASSGRTFADVADVLGCHRRARSAGFDLGRCSGAGLSCDPRRRHRRQDRSAFRGRCLAKGSMTRSAKTVLSRDRAISARSGPRSSMSNCRMPNTASRSITSSRRPRPRQSRPI